MNVIRENLLTPVTDHFDVIVAGGGVAGIAAALAAARQGARVALLEKQYMLGGLATAGLVTIYLPLCDGCGTQVSFGIAEELLRLSIAHGYEADYPEVWLEKLPEETENKEQILEQRKKRRYQVRFNAQLFAIAAEQLLLKEKVTVFYGTGAVSVKMDKDRISAVMIENKSGRSALLCKSVVDATGDADICVMAGEETVLFEQKNVLASWYYYSHEHGYDLSMLGYADIPETEKTQEQKKADIGKRRFTGLDSAELTEMMCLSHDSILRDVERRRQQDPSVMPVTIATIPQVRMTRRIVGNATMDVTDDRKSQADSIGIISNWKKRGPVYEVPFGCLHGSRVKNLITAGRSISATDPMWDVTRVIPPCAVTGQAAGTAAAMTADFSTINIADLQKKLENSGVVIAYKDLL